MATVHVNTWNEFVSAVGVAGDTVVLPEGDLEWDMNEILPYGLTQDVTIACHMIEGNGFRIKNLNLNSYKFMYSGTDIKYFRNLKCTDWIGTDVFFFLRYGSDFYCCTISGITSNRAIIDCSNTYSYSKCDMLSCSINIESSASRFGLGTSLLELRYCRVEIHAPNSTLTNCVDSPIFCELILYLPNANETFYSHQLKGCTLRGNMPNITSDYKTWGDWEGYPTVYLEETFPVAFVTNYPNYFIKCTESEFKDAAFLRSKGFPIIVDGGGS